MNLRPLHTVATLVLIGAAADTAPAANMDGTEPPGPPGLVWTTVVNNNDLIPPLYQRQFNSYNQPSVNAGGVVVLRARSRGGSPAGRPTHGIYVRDMGVAGSSLVRILDNRMEVPQPNNVLTPPGGSALAAFVETPAFPRIDRWSDAIVTRGNHPPVWSYLLPDGTETRTGTTGIYTNPFGELITGAAKLGAVPGFEQFAVPGVAPALAFDVFPGAPAITGSAIVFKGNYTLDMIGRTGVFYRRMLPEGEEGSLLGAAPTVLIANNVDTLIPGTDQVFGSVSPPSAEDDKAVFAGFDDEQLPTAGGIYVAALSPESPLTPLVGIGERVPGEGVQDTFAFLGEGTAFDGRRIGFWGAWGAQTKTVRLYCPQEGNKDRIAYCNGGLVCADTGEVLGDPTSVCDDTSDPMYPICYQEKQVPVSQGIFVHDTEDQVTRTVAKTGQRFDEFVFWGYSGKVPCVGSGHQGEGGEDDGEAIRWRSSAFVAVSGPYTAFKARAGDQLGIYAGKQPGQAITTVVDTSMDGQSLDPEAPPGSMIMEVGIEREGLRDGWLAISAKMGVEGGEEEDGMAGIYVTHLPAGVVLPEHAQSDAR